MKLIIEDDEGRKTVVPFVREEITIGRQEGNTIRLTERNVSRRHARLVRQNGHVLVEDLGSYNGIRINGERISGQTPIQDGDLLQIGDYDLAIQSEAQPQTKDLLGATGEVAQPRRAVVDEPETEADAPIISPSEVVDGEEDTSPSAKEASAVARRQSTSIIRVDKLEAERAKRPVTELDPEEAPRLFVLNTELAGREFACIRTELRFGRTDDNDIALDHRSLSRSHAKLVREDNNEWRVIDLQSANGVRVNGEPYAQATLRSGDVIELGHVKLKFLAPGETFRFVPGAYDDATAATPAKRGKLLPVILALVVVIAVGASLMLPQVRAAIGLGAKPTEGPGTPVNPAPRTETPKPAPGNTGNEAPAPQEAGLQQKLQGARVAMDANEFERAADILESAKGADGARPKEAEDMLRQAKLEISARKNIAQAQKELAAGRAEQAAELLAGAEGTVAFAKEYEATKAKVESTRGDTKGKAGSEVVSASGTAPSNASATADELYNEGTSLYRKKRLDEASALFTRCIELDPTFARCHMMLGSTAAKMRQWEIGAQHYRKFLELAPDHPKAEEVRRLLEQYERERH